MKYYLTDGQNKVGPFSNQQIMEMLSLNKISIMDQICSDKDPSWLMIFQHPDFTGEWTDEKPSDFSDTSRQKGFLVDDGMSATNTSLNIIVDQEKTGKKVIDQWYLLDEDGRAQGPFSYLILLGMLQDKKLKDTDLVRKGTQEWKRVSEFSDFSSEVLKMVASENPNLGKGPIHFRRHHDREETQKIVWVRKQNQILKALCVDVSEAGMALVLRTTNMDKNDVVEIFLSQSRVQVGTGVKAIVKGKTNYDNEVDQSIHQYGIQFLPSSQQAMSEIKDLVAKIRQLNLASKKIS